jgi:hypothetical protein
MTECVVAEFRTRAGAKLALEVLERNHYTLENVSVVMHNDDPAADRLDDLRDDDAIPADQAEATAPDSRSVGLGMLLGGTVAAPLALGTMIGPFFLVGPLVGMGIGAAMGGLFSSQQRGDSAEENPSYEDRVKAGSILVVVTQDKRIGLNEAEAVLATTNPKTMERFELNAAK